MVTSSTRIALSRQVDDPEMGVPVVDGSAVGEPVGGICVGTVKACLVGGRVEVTKRGGTGVAVPNSSVETLKQEVMIIISRANAQIFFIRGFYFEIINSYWLINKYPIINAENFPFVPCDYYGSM
jgi:hypothetical protein